MYQQEKVLPYQDGERKSAQVTRMFDTIADKYDDMNHIMSLGIDRYWRNRLIKSVKKTVGAELISARNVRLLDIATGTGDLLILAAKKLFPRDGLTQGQPLQAPQLIGIDISEGMMEIGRRKAKALARKTESNELRNILDSIQFVNEDATRMSFPDESFDLITTSFGIRNFENLDAALREMNRVLKTGGTLAMMELSEPVATPMRQLYRIYSRTILPLLGMLVARKKTEYDYLTRSIEAFPQGERMIGIVKKAGFSKVTFERLTFGICTLYIINK